MKSKNLVSTSDIPTPDKASSGKIQGMSSAAFSHANTTGSAELVQALSEENAQLKRQLAWFKQQLFGSKSEKRMIENPEQPLLTGLMGEPVEPLPPGDKQKITYERGKAKRTGGTTVLLIVACASAPRCP